MLRFAGVLFAQCVAAAAVWAESVELNIHCWEGYAQPYVAGFQQRVKDKFGLDVTVNITHVSDPAEFWTVARSGLADLISPAHNILKSDKWPFIRSELAVPVDLTHIPNYAQLYPFLQHNSYVVEADEVYAVPYTMGPYGLAYNAELVAEPDSWTVLWSEQAKGRYAVSKDYADANVYIAALAKGADYDVLYDINALWSVVSKSTLQTALNELALGANSLWVGTANPDEFTHLHYAATWGFAVAEANKKGLNWKMARPKEGTTVWVDHWVMTRSVLKHPERKRLAEEWIDYSLSAIVQTGVVRNWGVSPVVRKLDSDLTDLEVQIFAVGDEDYWNGLSLWGSQDKRTNNANALMWQAAMELRE